VAARASAQEMVERLLSNPVIEEANVDVRAATRA
jgi:phosphoribosylformylglycinamidine (FGAM) synthase PurS component